MAMAKGLGWSIKLQKEEEEVEEGPPEETTRGGKSETVAKRLGWFKKMHKEEEEQEPAEETTVGGKREKMASKRVGWFKMFHKGYNQWRPRKFGGGRVPSWRWRCLPLRRFSAFFYDLAFRFLYYLESVVLVSGLCCFFLCCGFHV